MTTTTDTTTQATTKARSRFPGWAVPFAAAAVGALIWLIGNAAGVDIAAVTGTGVQQVGLVAVIAAALVIGFLGWGVRTLLRKRSSGGATAWLILCGALLLVSLLGPLGGASAAAMAVLAAEHLAVGATIALGLRR